MKLKLIKKYFKNFLKKKKKSLNNKQKSLNNNLNFSRRDFLKIMGYGTAAVLLSSCRGPIIKSIPYIKKPDIITPGIPNYYSSTMFDGFDSRCVLVKTREGRPIKIEINKEKELEYFNSLSTRIQSSIYSLYDIDRLKYPIINEIKSSWKDLDNYVINKIKKIIYKKKKIIILTSSLPSPSTKKIIYYFSKIYKKIEHVIYDSFSYSKSLNASKKIFGVRGFPIYNIENAKLIISFDADFLGSWYPGSLEKQYINGKKKNMLCHIQFESNMTLSGANADIRIPLIYTKIKKILYEIYLMFFKEKYKSKNKIAVNLFYKILKYGSNTIILSDGDEEDYIISNLINIKLKSSSLSGKFFFLKESNDKLFNNFLKDLEEEKIGGLFIYNINPVYSYLHDNFKKKIKKIDLSVYFTSKKNETSEYTKVIAPIPHWLESWGDLNPLSGLYTLTQPTIRPIFNVRQFQDSLLIWIKYLNKKLKKKFTKLQIKDYYDYLKFFWEKNIIPKSNRESFNQTLFYGFLLKKKNYKKIFKKNLNKKFFKKKIIIKEKFFKKNKNNSFFLKIYIKNCIGDGTQSNNPWLHELPDPITKTTWDNYITISYHDAKKLNLKNWYIGNGAMNGNYVQIFFEDKLIKKVPVYIQPGQAIGSIGIAIGYGRKKEKVVEKLGGINAYIFYKDFNSIKKNIFLKKDKGIHKFSCTQLQNTLVGRKNIAKEISLTTFLKEPKEKWNKEEKIKIHENNFYLKNISLWKNNNNNEKDTGHHFNLLIDLNACIGCNSCIISCNSENNIPIVGKEEIRKFRDMHWIRIDRYYSSENEEISSYSFQKSIFSEFNNYKKLEKPNFYNPKVIFQPIMCQHCNNAPCETVCPVSATSHGVQGQNMMAYNRCIGTRYCANNCPYKVRRFNWFNYMDEEKFTFNNNNELSRMVLNPDVVVRSRGVMEKCSLCIQRTQYVILKHKKEENKIKDEEFQTACSIACPTEAIIFGDINDKDSKIYKEINDKRSYKLLEFLGTRPNVSYQVKIRNDDFINDEFINEK